MDNGTLAARRQIALYHLRNNPKNRKQGRWDLYDPIEDTYCALGLLAEGFGYDVRHKNSRVSNEIYDEFCESLGLHSGLVYRANDTGHDFSQVADIMEEYFRKFPDRRHDPETEPLEST